jgi:hypothetical protein
MLKAQHFQHASVFVAAADSNMIGKSHLSRLLLLLLLGLCFCRRLVHDRKKPFEPAAAAAAACHNTFWFCVACCPPWWGAQTHGTSHI